MACDVGIVTSHSLFAFCPFCSSTKLASYATEVLTLSLCPLPECKLASRSCIERNRDLIVPVMLEEYYR